MGTRFRFLAGVVLPGLLLSLSACTTSSSSTPSGSGPGALFVATQGDSSVSAYTIDLTTGTINANGDSVPTGSVPAAMLLSPSGTALFVANSGTNDISAYTVKTDGTLTASKRNHPDGWNDPVEHGHGLGRTFPLCGESRTADRSGFGHSFGIRGPGCDFDGSAGLAISGCRAGSIKRHRSRRRRGHARRQVPLRFQSVRQHSDNLLGGCLRGPDPRTGGGGGHRPIGPRHNSKRRLSVCRQFKHAIRFRDLQPGCDHLQRSHRS